jgi:hypothetical protein
MNTPVGPAGSKSGLVIGGFLAFICAVLYPVAYLPLKSRNIKEELESQPGFSKRGMWKELENN